MTEWLACELLDFGARARNSLTMALEARRLVDVMTVIPLSFGARKTQNYLLCSIQHLANQRDTGILSGLHVLRKDEHFCSTADTRSTEDISIAYTYIHNNPYAHFHIPNPNTMGGAWQAQLPPTARHLTKSPTLACGIVRLQNTRLALIGLRESVATLFPHALDLSHLANGLLELLHPNPQKSVNRLCDREFQGIYVRHT